MKKILLSIAITLNILFITAQATLTLQPDPCTGKDAYLGDIQGPQNFGNATEISAIAWTCGGNPCIAKCPFQFDLSAIPQGSTIISATLSLYANTTSSNGVPGSPTWGSNNASNLKRITSPWSETAVTWNTAPTTTTVDQVLLPQSTTTAQDYLNIDITTFVQYWNQNPSQNYGMMLEMITTTALNSLLFCSSDHADSTKRPKLVITYTPPANACITLQPGECTGKDAYLGDIQGTQNFGNATEISAIAWTCGGSPCIAKCPFQFDLSAVPQNATITSAILSLYANTTSSNGVPGSPTWGTNNASYLKRITSAWSEMGVTWNTAPTVTTVDQVLLPQSTSTAQDYLNIDITTFVQYWNQNPSQNYGMMLEMITTTPLNSLLFCSSEHSDSTKRPKLEICFSVPTSIAEINPLADLKVFPNPATNQLTMNLNGIKVQQVNIYNVDGKLMSETNQPANNQLDISHLASGVYIAEVKVNNAMQRVRWVKM